ncbi:MAG: hypothetical protein ACI8QS_001523, partial [Planctomycetota bacterium]
MLRSTGRLGRRAFLHDLCASSLRLRSRITESHTTRRISVGKYHSKGNRTGVLMVIPVLWHDDLE